MTSQTPVLDSELERFQRDLLAAAARTPARRFSVPRSQRLVLAVVIVFVLAVPAALGAFGSLFSNDRPQLSPPPGYSVPQVVGSGTEIASGTVSGGAWHAYAVRCGSGAAARASIVVVTPNGSRNSAACGAIPPGGPRAVPTFAPSLLYDGDAQTTWIFESVPSRVARVTLNLVGHAKSGPVTLPGAGPSHHELTPIENPEAQRDIGLDVKFVVLAVAGEQEIEAADAFDAAGQLISHCDENTHCEDVNPGASG
jgi:hypothetical protein